MTRDRLVTATFDTDVDACHGDLPFLLGTWRFSSTFGTTVFDDHYRLDSVDENECFVIGQDLDSGDAVIASSATEAGYDYALLDPGFTICDFFVFDRTGPNSVKGFDILTDSSCENFLTGNLNPMTGTRTAPASLARTSGLETEAIRVRDDALRSGDGLGLYEVGAHVRVTNTLRRMQVVADALGLLQSAYR